MLLTSRSTGQHGDASSLLKDFVWKQYGKHKEELSRRLGASIHPLQRQLSSGIFSCPDTSQPQLKAMVPVKSHGPSLNENLLNKMLDAKLWGYYSMRDVSGETPARPAP